MDPLEQRDQLIEEIMTLAFRKMREGVAPAVVCSAIQVTAASFNSPAICPHIEQCLKEHGTMQ